MVDTSKLKSDIRQASLTQNSFNYELQFPDGRLGKAGIVFFPVHFFDYTNFYEHLLEKGLKPNDSITFINSFYPNGEYVSEEHMRKGAGSAFLELIIKDSADWGSAVLYGSTVSKSMASFLQKKGFIWYADERYYKLVKQN
ncbi:MAG: hypothetical protein NTY99_01585 [DPANN group archaeon]|nr:hypothetical protein [DPANN group archaeon]